MPTTLVVPGVKILVWPDEADKKAEDVFGVSIRTKSAVRVDAVTRGEAREVPIPVTDEEQKQGIIAELEFEDGLRQWIPVKTLRERLAQTERSYVRDDVVRIPVNISGQGTRGVGDWALKGFKLLDILLPQEAFDPATGPAARAIAAYYENRLKPEPGLYAIDRQGSLTKQPGNAPLPASDDPYLVLLHGTFSTTGSSFGRLIRSAEWMELSDVYSTRIVGLNHRTLSESPAQNALDLVKQLPAKARAASAHPLAWRAGGRAAGARAAAAGYADLTGAQRAPQRGNQGAARTLRSSARETGKRRTVRACGLPGARHHPRLGTARSPLVRVAQPHWLDPGRG